MKLSGLIAPSFHEVHKDIKDHGHTHYWLKGGRGSTKSSFVSVEIILGIIRDARANCVAIRRFQANLKDSVFNQLKWAIDMLGVSEYFLCHISPMEIIYIPTGQKILFRGTDDPTKIKSLKVPHGYVKYVWYEEADQFRGMSEIRTINQSLLRGGRDFVVFYSYNPPQSMRSWVNEQVLEKSPDKLVHHSSYLDVPREWLGEQFILEAENLKRTHPDIYEHDYMGAVTGTGGEVFVNLVIDEITDELIKSFDHIYEGIDFGFAADPFVYVKCHYDKKYKRIYVFDEIYKLGLSNARAAELIKPKKTTSRPITADSAEPKSIAEMRSLGLKIVGAKKGPDSVEYGIKFLQSLDSIIIDPVRCPETKKEFMGYELEKDKDDRFKDGYPDKDNHTIDAVRYALESEISNKKARVLERRSLGI